MSESSFLEITEKILDKICERIDHFIKWPTRDKYDEIARDFDHSTWSEFPGIIGAIDSCHLMIEPMGDEWFTCYNYKQYHSIHLQVTF